MFTTFYLVAQRLVAPGLPASPRQRRCQVKEEECDKDERSYLPNNLHQCEALRNLRQLDTVLWFSKAWHESRAGVIEPPARLQVPCWRGGYPCTEMEAPARLCILHCPAQPQDLAAGCKHAES